MRSEKFNTTEPEPEFELEFTRKDKADYRWYLAIDEEYKGLENLPKAAAKPRTKKKKLGEAQQTRSKARSSRIASKGIHKRML